MKLLEVTCMLFWLGLIFWVGRLIIESIQLAVSAAICGSDKH